LRSRLDEASTERFDPSATLRTRLTTSLALRSKGAGRARGVPSLFTPPTYSGLRPIAAQALRILDLKTGLDMIER
jgi:hypothetical protein